MRHSAGPALLDRDVDHQVVAEARTRKEAAARAAFANGELSLDRYELRSRLPGLGIEYVSYQEHQR